MSKIRQFDLSEYPVLGPIINLSPGDLFRLEDVTMEHEAGTYTGNGLFMFTGLFHSDPDSRVDNIYCVPIYFYGNNAEDLTQKYSGENVWVQLTEIQGGGVKKFTDGYLN